MPNEVPGGPSSASGTRFQANNSFPSFEDTTGAFEVDEIPQSSSETSPPPSLLNCRCVERTLVVLEDIEAKVCHRREPMDAILAFHKKSLDHCSAILDCKNCKTISCLVSLSIMICEKLLTATNLSFSGVESVTTFEEEKKLQGVNTANFAPKKSPRMFLGEYEIESHDERAVMISVLRGISGKRIAGILCRVENLALPYGRPTQLERVQSLKQKI